MSENCVGCGHGVVCWDSYESKGSDDLICQWCGLHSNSASAKLIREARTLIKDIKELPRFDIDVGPDDFKYGTKHYGKNGRFVDAYDLKGMIALSGF